MGSKWLIRCAAVSVWLLLVGCVTTATSPAPADSPAPRPAARNLTCEMHFSLDSWAVLYKHARGTGTVTCKNGQTMDVKLDANGAGLTLGDAKVAKGTARFAGVTAIRDVLGAYIGVDSTTAVDKLGTSDQAFSNGPVGMVLYGKSEGVSLGTALEGLVIKEAPPPKGAGEN